MRVVIDTNVLVAAARSRRGASNALLSTLPDVSFQPVISASVFVEYRATLLRPENLLQRSAQQAEGFLDFLLSVSHLQEIFFLWRPALPDPNDDLILELRSRLVADIYCYSQSPGFPGNREMGSCSVNTVRCPQIDRERDMSTVTIQMPESLARELREYAAREGMTVDQLLSSAAAEKLSALMTVEHLRQRAAGAKREDFLAFLNGSPDVPPLPGDEL